MDLVFKKPFPAEPKTLLRHAGYREHFDPNTNRVSFSLRLGSLRYPRFHCYVKETEQSVSFHLHIDQKEASYAGSHMHAGEYEGPLVKEELQRIERWVKAALHTPREKKENGRKGGAYARWLEE
jgi:hypothetical protein